MEDELQAARERRLQRWIDQIVADFRSGFKWPQGPLEEPQPRTVGRSHLKLVDSQPAKIES